MEKIFANHISENALISKYVKNSYNSIAISQITQFKNGQRSWIAISPKKIHERLTGTWKDVQHHESLGKCKLKPQWDITTLLVRLAIIKMTRDDESWCGCREKGTLVYCWKDCKSVQALWKTVWRILKKIKSGTTLLFSNSTSGNKPKWNENTNSKRYLHSNVHSNIIYSSQDMETT